MIIIEDTRNQIGKHEELNRQLQAMGHTVIRSKLLVGDYSTTKNQSICIDTKKDILEVAGNICGKQHIRFREECERAKLSQIRLIVLIEEQTPIKEWNMQTKGAKSSHTQVKGETLYKAMATMHQKYAVDFIQCDKKDTAKIIVKILEKLWN